MSGIFSLMSRLSTPCFTSCHNENGPHNTDFYNLLDEIRKECEQLMVKGVTGSGQGFDLPGRRLGGYSRQPPLSLLRDKARATAETRAQCEGLLSQGPKRLAGDSSIKAIPSPIQAAVMATERRLHNDLWCGSKSLQSEGSSKHSEVPVTLGDRSTLTSFVEPIFIQGRKDCVMWQCTTCTLLNQTLALTCEVCGTPHSKNIGDYKKLEAWSGKFCTLDNSIEADRCMACGEWRYSYGPPISTPAPYLG